MTSPAILVPVKTPDHSKKRLKTILTRDQRAELIRCLTRDCLEHLNGLETSVHAGIISSDLEIGELARSYGITVVEEPSDTETLGELVDGASSSFIEGKDAEGLLVFPVDLPRLDGDSIDDLLQQARGKQVLLVPDGEQEGTNALWRSPADVINCQYEGTASFDNHVEVARQQGIEPVIVEKETFAFDLDTPDDWYRMLEAPDRLGEHTRSFVEEMLMDLPSQISGGA